MAADGTLVLYSLDPPARVERVSGASGKYDPFFDYGIRKAEAERDAAEQGAGPGKEDPGAGAEPRAGASELPAGQADGLQTPGASG